MGPDFKGSVLLCCSRSCLYSDVGGAVTTSFANKALLCSVSRENERVVSVGSWIFEVERSFVV